MRANDALSGLVLIIASLAMIVLTLKFPEFHGQKYGPALFPRILGVGLVVCGGMLIWNGLAARRAGAPWVAIAPWVYEPWRLTSFFLTLALLVLYILVSETVGFIPMSLLFLGSLFFWLGVPPITALITAVVGTFTIHWFFASMLRVPLPRGWLNSVL